MRQTPVSSVRLVFPLIELQDFVFAFEICPRLKSTPQFPLFWLSFCVWGMERKHFYCCLHIKVFTGGGWIYLEHIWIWKHRKMIKTWQQLTNDLLEISLNRIQTIQSLKWNKPLLTNCWEINHDMESIFVFRLQFVRRLWDA